MLLKFKRLCHLIRREISLFRALLFVLALCCLFILKYYLFQSAFEKELHDEQVLLPSVLRDVAAGIQETKRRPKPANYSVLNDPFYAVKLDKKRVLAEAELANTQCARIKVAIAMDYTLCYYKEDWLVSRVLEKGTSQLRGFGMLLRILQQIPNAAFVDVGANLGMFALPIIAALGHQRKAIAIEAFPKNIGALQLSVIKNNFPSENWAFIQRAFTTQADKNVNFALVVDSETRGSLLMGKEDPFKIFAGAKISVLTATYDSHLLPVAKAMNITTAVMKIDIDGSDCPAMLGGSDFLTEIHVPYILMEYEPNVGLLNYTCLEIMMPMMRKFSYKPFRPESVGTEGMLNIDEYRNWPYFDILWKKII